MHQPQFPSVDALRRESENTRAALAGTVTELRDRVSATASDIKTMISPTHIKEEIRTFVREERDNFRESIERRVRENPLQSAAIGAALAYPALGLLRAIPLPLMLIGVGLFLTSSRGKKSMAAATEKVGEVFDDGVARASSMAGELKDAVAHRAEPLTRALNQAGDTIAEHTDALAQGIRRNVHDIRDTASDAFGKVASTVDAASEKVSGEVMEARAQASSTMQKSQSTLMEWIERNPLAVAGIGAAIGAFIAAALPPSSTEDTMLGKASDALKDQASDAVSGGLAKAKEMASDVVEDVKAAAAREGLDSDAMKQTAETVTQSVKAVADRGVKTALKGLQQVSDAPETPSSQTH